MLCRRLRRRGFSIAVSTESAFLVEVPQLLGRSDRAAGGPVLRRKRSGPVGGGDDVGQTGAGVKAQGQIQRSRKREWAIAGGSALSRRDSFVLACSAVRALAFVSAWPAASKKVAASPPSRIPRQPVTCESRQ